MRWKDVCRLAAQLPEVQLGVTYGSPALCVRGGLVARLLDDKKSIVVKVGMDERAALCAAKPATFLVTAALENYSMVVVRLAAAEPDELSRLLANSWRLAAPPSLVERSGRSL